MRVKYQTRVVDASISVNSGTPSQWGDFWEDVILALIDMGAPLDPNAIIKDGTYVAVAYLGSEHPFDGGSGIGLYKDNDDSGNATMCVEGTGSDPETYSNYVSVGEVIAGWAGNGYADVVIHAVKSGDSFFFGFSRSDESRSAPCINYAITQMRRLSDPSTSMGYALVCGFFQTKYGGVYAGRALPYIAGVNYWSGERGYISSKDVYDYPEVETGKIPLIPLYAGIEDVYYDKVYLSPMRRNTEEEKAFETDKGVFLISGHYGTDWSNKNYCMFAFDITEAVNAQ